MGWNHALDLEVKPISLFLFLESKIWHIEELLMPPEYTVTLKPFLSTVEINQSKEKLLFFFNYKDLY